MSNHQSKPEGAETDRDRGVVLVDDEEMVAGALRSFIELESDYEVLTFTDPAAALDTLRERRVHAIVSDLMMPRIDGIALLTAAREIQPETSRILLTGYAEKRHAIQAIQQVALFQFVEKPWDNEQIALMIRNAVERTAMWRELNQRLRELEDVHDELAGLRERWMRALL